MNVLEQISVYLRRLESRFRLSTVLSGAAVTAITALVSTVLLTLLTNWFAFSERSMSVGRLALFFCVAFALGFGLAVPLLKFGRRKAARSAEAKFPEFQQRLLTIAEKESDSQEDPFLELLAADTVEAIQEAEPQRVVTNRRILGFLSAVAIATAALIWLTIAGPGFLGYGASLLWGGTPRTGNQPFYDIVVDPGTRSVRRGASQAVTARLVGFESRNVRLYARYKSASRWEEAAMLPREGSSAAYEFLFAGIPETVDYYVDSGRLRSEVYTLSVIDLPELKRIRVTYRYPDWTGLKDAVEEPGGDLRAVEGTEAEIAVETNRPLKHGVLVLVDGKEVPLSSEGGMWNSGRLTIEEDGVYHVAVREQNELIRLSDDYFIEARKDRAPLLRIVRPGRDARVSPIEEVTVEVEAEDDFGLRDVELRYSVNGGAEEKKPLLNQSGAKTASRSATFYLEDYGLSPGDLVAMYATARDARAVSRTDIYFLEAQPFEREFTQIQVAGGRGGQGGEQSRISQRQKEIIAATWNQLRDTSSDRQAAAENAKFLAGVQEKLREQASSLARRMRRRELSAQNQEFKSFSENMEKAAEAMGDAASRLKSLQWREALQPEQKALQYLLRAEAMFRQIQVAFGSRGAGGRGGMGRDLENLFDLELDTEKNQYETGQQAASSSERAREIDEALQRLEQLARRQRELAQRQRQPQQSSQQRWQQEMLRREAEELQRRMEQLTRGQPQSLAQGQQSGESGESASSSRGQPRRLSSLGRRSQADPRLEQALRRLEQATEDMRRAGRGEAESRRAAERLQEARDLLRGVRSEQSSEQLDEMVQQAEQLADQQRDFAGRVQQLFRDQPDPGAAPTLRRGLSKEQFLESQRLAAEKQRMAETLARLEREMQRTARDLAGSQPAASSKVRQALGVLQDEELALRLRYNTELLRRGLGQYARLREAPITTGLQDLRDRLREARAALEQEPARRGDAEQVLAQVEQLRRQIERMAQGGGGPMNDFSAMNLGDRQPPAAGGTASQSGVPAGETRRLYRESLRDLSQLRQAMRDAPEAARDIQQLIREMQALDPSRFPGNPELLVRLRTQVLPVLEQIELQLRRELEENQEGQVRTSAPDAVPAGYADAVAEYFRRLSRQR